MKIPVICPHATSLSETIGDAAFIFKLFSVEDMADKIIKFWTDEDYRIRSVENNKKTAGSTN